MSDTLTPEALGEQTGEPAVLTPELSATSEDSAIQSAMPPTEQTQQTEDVLEKTPYTDEEFETVPFAQMDESRLTSSQKKLLGMAKSLEAGYTKKFQSLAEERRNIQAQPQTDSLEEVFDSDPIGTLAEIDARIDTEREVNPLGEPLRKLESLRRGLERRFYNAQIQKETMSIAQQQELAVRSMADRQVREAIPDFDTKKEALTSFAVEHFGISPQDLNALTNPNTVINGARLGQRAINLVVGIDKLFSTMNAGSTVSEKTVVPAPLLRSSQSSGTARKDPSKMSYADYKKARTEGKL